MRPLPHGYTNATVGDGRIVVKRYEGPDAADRLERERRFLNGLAGAVPVPPVLDGDGESLTIGFVAGVQGQELVEAGHAAAVMRACGAVLRRLHALPAPAGTVLVHGDFGPNNVLVDPATFAVTAVLDWEFARYGDRIADLAWCEWIMRTHHPARAREVEHFHAAYGLPVPPWLERRDAMVERCRELRDFCERWQPGGGAVRQWEQRAAATAAWGEDANGPALS
ncbi:phosphotransferase family protein [Glycomyces terrestris]|uniref:Aminoglycoside phosphotransferase family protein n=1 Tax=Glycomyces terrestris TaxID=2493553 RepID=A0A426UV92_9ACTN|nr:aminoglycoside phosphotransferase family protein [Glycomyces terrestris]RRR98163.1 aminoglycoside phosphotransferase family protein [Glycomyces terrestris]